MNTEINDLDMILSYLETTSLEPHDDYTSEFTYKDQKILYKYIKQLQQENKKLKMINKEYERLGKEKGRGFKITNVQEHNIDELLSYKKYKDNWDKLKEFLEEWKENEEYCYLASSPIDRCRKDIYGEILDKMQEIEQGSDSNE